MGKQTLNGDDILNLRDYISSLLLPMVPVEGN